MSPKKYRAVASRAQTFNPQRHSDNKAILIRNNHRLPSLFYQFSFHPTVKVAPRLTREINQ